MIDELEWTECPECGGKTEFVQFASGEEETVATSVNDVDGRLLELRSCLECGVGIENILDVVDRTVVNVD